MALVRGDALALPLRDGCAQCVVTSPPYLGQRIYGGSAQYEIGREEGVDAFAMVMVDVGREVRRVLRDDGIWWLNLGDKANGSGGAGGDYNAGGAKTGKPRYGRFRDPLFEVGQFLDVPGKVIDYLQDAKWRLRQYIIWDKGVESRESLEHVNRPRTSHEVILMLQPGPGRAKFFPDRLVETGSVWHFPPAHREGKNHQAPFPDELAHRCISCSTDVGDLVVDPFVGSGTTTRVANELERRAFGVDLYAGACP